LKLVKCNREARAALARTTLEGLLSPSTWRELGFFASVKPRGDILPVRSLYNDTGNTNIGLNPAEDPSHQAERLPLQMPAKPCGL